MSLPSEVNPLLLASSSGYQISRSLRIRSSATAYLNRTYGVATNNQKGTISVWLKQGSLSQRNTVWASASGAIAIIIGATAGACNLQLVGSGLAGTGTTQVFRDPSAWFHLVVAVDTTQATGSDRVKAYINNTAITLPDTATQNAAFFTNSIAYNIGNYANNAALYYDGYMAEFNFVDGQQLTPASFGAFDAVTGVWNPKAYSGTYGNNGSYLNFSDNSAATAAAIGKDSSGNGNNWTPNNISVTAGITYDSMVDSPTNYGGDTGVGGTVRGNYCTFNPLFIVQSNSNAGSTWSNGNLQFTSGTNNVSSMPTMALPTTGKWYWEIVTTAFGGGSNPVLGICDYTGLASGLGGWWYRSDGNKHNQSGTGFSYGATWTTNDVIGVAVDMDAATLTFYKNGVSQGVAWTSITSNVSGTLLYPFVRVNIAGDTYVGNFGQRPFAYTAPSGYKTLCTQNLPAVSIPNPNKHFDVLTTTATNSTGMTLSGLQFQPDFFWRKNRNNSEAHYLFDRVRGSTSFLSSSTAGAEAGYPSADGSVTFNSDGYTIADSNWNNGEFYFNGRTYVDWFWKAGGTAVTNNNGTISSQVSANPTAGFSIVGYTGTGTTGATVGHGLGAVPQMIIVKNRSASAHWPVGHVGLTSWAYNLYFSLTNAQASVNTSFNSTTPSSTVFTLGPSGNETNLSGQNFVAYCFAPIAGYSAFGSYAGNSSTDGAFVYLGFRARWIMIKGYDSGEHWILYDTARDRYNVVTNELYVNLANAEGTYAPGLLDITANGFKLRYASAPNISGRNYIYAAFAENPFTIARAR